MPVQIDNLQRGNTNQRNVSKWHGFYRALVIDSADPRQLGRVKVRIPDLMPETGDKYTLEWDKNGLWAHSANNFLGGRNQQDMVSGRPTIFDDGWYQGSCLIPPAGSWVWVFFENGEPNHPYYFGSLEAGQRKVLPENQTGSEWWKKWTLIKTKAGRCIVISDDEDDCRVEITGKKRLITSEPDGDLDSVFTIDDNQTTILIDERPGEEKLQLKDYRGNYITFHTNDGVGQDQLHIFFKDDIHIETQKNLYIKTALDMQVDVGGNYALTAGGNIDQTSGGNTKETSGGNFDRLSSGSDTRTAAGEIKDTGLGRVTHCAGGEVNCASGGCMKMTSSKVDIKGSAVNVDASGTMNIKSGGEINMSGAKSNVECGSSPAATIWPIAIAAAAIAAIPAILDGERRQGPAPVNSPDPVIPPEDMTPPVPIIIPPVLGDPYEIAVGSVPIVPPEPIPTLAPPVVQTIPAVSTPTPPTPTPITRIFGVGHMFALHLKDVYRETIVPLVDKSYGTYTGFYLFRDIDPEPEDYQFFDPAVVAVYDNYRNPTSWTIDDTTKWWQNLDDICQQSSAYNMTVVPTLFDFCCSSHDPFLTHIQYPYTTFNWDDSIQGEYVKKVIQHIKSSGVGYLINLGCKNYNNAALPDSGWLRKLIMFLLDSCGVPSDKLALTSGPSINLFEKNPYCRYKMFTGSRAPQTDEINNEEYVDGNWGGTGRVEVYDNQGNLIGGYVKYIYDCSEDGIACMNTWKMNRFTSSIPIVMDISNPNVMNYIFAPRQREAMRKVLGGSDTNNGYIEF